MWKLRSDATMWEMIKEGNIMRIPPDVEEHQPGARVCAAIWAFENSVIIFGGYNSITSLSDVWKFNISSNSWSWINHEYSAEISFENST